MDKKRLYRKAYRMLEARTPLKQDCGRLCNRKCCSGGDNMGMCLFPGEYEIFEKKLSFMDIKQDTLHEQKVLTGVCHGSCSRNARPLACRIYPFLPYMGKNGQLAIVEDPRAKYTCPLLWHLDEIHVSLLFKRKLYDVFCHLCRDEDIKRHVLELSKVVEDYRRYTG